MEEKINILINADDKKAFDTLYELELITTESNELYSYFDTFLDMLNSDRTFVRVRGFRMICSLAKWDIDNRIDNNIDDILKELDDDTATSVRQCLSKINLIIMYKINLIDKIEVKMNSLNLCKYKESMQSLIERDIKRIIENL